jgi:hypothetical protein
MPIDHANRPRGSISPRGAERCPGLSSGAQPGAEHQAHAPSRTSSDVETHYSTGPRCYECSASTLPPGRILETRCGPRVLSGRCDRGRECRTGSRRRPRGRPRGSDPEMRRAREKGGPSVPPAVRQKRGQPMACPGRPIPERATPARATRGSAQGREHHGRTTHLGALLPTPGRLSAVPRRHVGDGGSNPSAQGRLPSRGVGPGWGAPGASPKHSLKGRPPRPAFTSEFGSRREAALPRTRARTARPALGARQPRPAGPRPPAPLGSSATPSARSSSRSAASSPASCSSPRTARAGAPQCYSPACSAWCSGS